MNPYASTSNDGVGEDSQYSQQQQQQQQQLNDDGNHNHYHHHQQQQQPNNLAVEQPQQHQQQEEIKQLQSRLAQQEETNFDLNVEIATLQAELKNSEKTLKEKSVQEKSKWEHDLRLAQQEAQKWKLKYQKQQQQQQQQQHVSTYDNTSKEVDGQSHQFYRHQQNQHHQQQQQLHHHHHDENNVNQQQQQQQQQRFAPPPKQQHLQQQLHLQPGTSTSAAAASACGGGGGGCEFAGNSNNPADDNDNNMDLDINNEVDYGMNGGEGRGMVHHREGGRGRIMTMKRRSSSNNKDDNNDNNNDDDDVAKTVHGRTNDKTMVENNGLDGEWTGTTTSRTNSTSTSTAMSPARRLAIELLSQVPEDEEDEEIQNGQDDDDDDEDRMVVSNWSLKNLKQQSSTTSYNYRMIRHALMNIAFNESNNNDTTNEGLFDGSGGGSGDGTSDDIYKTSLLQRPNHQPKPSPKQQQNQQCWTESSLVEWLILQSLICMKTSRTTNNSTRDGTNNINGGGLQSSPTAAGAGAASTLASASSSSSSLVDIYVYTALLQSPHARRHIVQKILNTPKNSLRRQKKPPAVHSGGGGGGGAGVGVDVGRPRRRNVRIHPISSGVDGSYRQQQLTVDDYERMRQSLLNPWCDLTTASILSSRSGGRNINDDDCDDGGDAAEIMSTPDNNVIHEWTHNLASSWSPTHLQILQVLVEEQSNMGISNDVWWDEGCFGTATRAKQTKLDASMYPSSSCVSSILMTIQTLVCRRLHQQRNVNATDSTSKFEGTSSGTNSGPGSRAANRQVNEKNPSRNTSGVKRDVLPYRFQVSSIAPSSFHKNYPKIRKSDTKHHDKIDPLLTIFQPSDDETLERALSALNIILSVSSFRKLEEWYRSRIGLHIVDDDEEEEDSEVADSINNPNETDITMGGRESDLKQITATTKTIPGGLFVVSILLEMMEGLQFLEWSKDENPLSLKHLYSIDTDMNIGPNEIVLPTWYYHIIPLFMTIGRTYAGMKVLRTRLPDFRNYDWTGNALDVSIRNLHVLVQFWDSVDILQPDSILRLEPIDHESPFGAVDQTRTRNQVGQVIEMWIRFWHQILLYVAKTDDKGVDSQLMGQSNPNTTQNDRDEACGVTFRYLFMDVQDWLTSAYTILMNSADTRQELKSMIYQQLQELSLDEEERDDSNE